MAILKRGSYLITSNTNDQVKFKVDNWLFRSRRAHFADIDEGEFEIVTNIESTQLTFKYYITFSAEIFITLFILVISFIMAEYLVVLFMGIPLWIQFSLRFFKLKEVGDEMLEKIVEGTVDNTTLTRIEKP